MKAPIKKAKIIKIRMTARNPYNISQLIDLQKKLPSEIEKLHRKYEKLSESADVNKIGEFKRVKAVLLKCIKVERQINEILTGK
ncbi:MAG: hypothetical protein HYW05_05460 [Candidatus Diapherotrites archaeon]|nr:hypothetical protein [Candidatus Diapherotrites archaeon]